MTAPWVDLLGYVGAAVGVSVTVPQTLAVLRARSGAGVSADTWSISTASSAVWLAYGLAISSPPQVPGNVLGTLGAALLVGALVRCRAVRPGRPVAVVALVALAAVAGYLLDGPAALGWLGTALSVGMRLPQLAVTVRGHAGEALAPLSWVLSGVSGVCWTAYGLATQDPPVVATSAFAVVAAAVIVTTSTRRTQRPEPEVVYVQAA